MFTKPKKWLPALATLLVATSNTLAAGAPALSEYNVSSTEQNRLAVEGRRLAQVVPKNKGTLTYIRDDANGALYFTFTDPDAAQGTETLFVVDDHNDTYQVLLQPRRIPSASIVLQPGEQPAHRTTGAVQRASSFQAAIKDLMADMAMAHDDPDGYTPLSAVPVNEDVPLWQEARLVLQNRYSVDDLVGEQYQLTNVSTGDMVVAEQELYRRGVVAVAIDQQTLAPGDSTAIYIVRGRGENE